MGTLLFNYFGSVSINWNINVVARIHDTWHGYLVSGILLTKK
jgi:hypothetical protein